VPVPFSRFPFLVFLNGGFQSISDSSSLERSVVRSSRNGLRNVKRYDWGGELRVDDGDEIGFGLVGWYVGMLVCWYVGMLVCEEAG
jgi:hypothetical protein